LQSRKLEKWEGFGWDKRFILIAKTIWKLFRTNEGRPHGC
jgi:hypothetical protein